MYDGFEIDMLSLGDADCLVVTQWHPQYGFFRVLIDGGRGSDVDAVKDFLLTRGFTHFYAVVKTHAHEDHAGGLIKLVQDTRFTFTNAWMHDIRNHIDPDILRSASAGNSAHADAVRQVIETTKELWSSFVNRRLIPKEPFTGDAISGLPYLAVLGPSQPFYKRVLADFAKIEYPNPLLSPAFWATAPKPSVMPISLSSLLRPPVPSYPVSSSIFAPINPGPSISLAGLLSNSKVKESPTTQPFNNTSVILGSVFKGNRMMFTADAGAGSLDCVPSEWKSLTWMQVPHHGSNGNLSQANIERFHPRYAYISSCGDSSHPSRAIVSGLIKTGGQVFSTHQNGHLWFSLGAVPPRSNYSHAFTLKGTGNPESVFDWTDFWTHTG